MPLASPTATPSTSPEKKVVDPTQQAEGDDAKWVNEPLDERHADLTPHTVRPYNAEPPNYALRDIITPLKLHYRRTHTPVPVVDADSYRVSIMVEGRQPRKFSLSELQMNYVEQDLVVTLMCTGNRRSEFNNEKDGETMGLPWKNGSISTARWSGASLLEVLETAGLSERSMEVQGYRFLTFYGIEDYHISIPLKKAFARDGDCILAWKMNGEALPRDHGYPLRVLVPGYVGARSVKWLDRIVVTKDETEGMHQRGIAYKQLAPNQKALSKELKSYIEALPPIDHVPITSAITSPEPGATVLPGDALTITGYAYSGVGLAVIRVDVSVDGGETWAQAELTRASEAQKVRSGRAWAWVQWQLTTTVPLHTSGDVNVVCKAIDDQYNQQPHDPSAIWNLRGILNTSWGRVMIHVPGKSNGFKSSAASQNTRSSPWVWLGRICGSSWVYPGTPP